MSIRIMIADDHAVFRSGLRALLEKEADLEVVSEASTGPETLKRLETNSLDVLILDISMPGGMTGSQTAEEALRISPNLAVVVLTMHEDEYYLKEMLKLGARAFMLKKSSAEQLVQAVRAAHRGEHFVDPSLAQHVISTYVGRRKWKEPGRLGLLTRREREVCRLLAMGHTNAEVGKKLFISERTVETHRANIMSKLELQNRAELVRFAMENGLLKLN